MAGWVSFFDGDHPLYVNAHHRVAHNALLARSIGEHIPGQDAVVLDYGCGEAFYAEALAARAGKLILSDAGPNRLAELDTRFAGDDRIEVRSPEEVALLPERSVDVIVMNSVAQYVTPEELDGMLRLFRRLIAPGGLVVIGDILSPDAPPFVEVPALLRFGAREGFLLAALGGLVRTALSSYPRLRSQYKLTRHRDDDLLARLAQAGFAGERAARNLGHDQSRRTFLARPA